MSTAVAAEVVRRPMMSGHCSTHIGHDNLSEQQWTSHKRCDANGAGNRANPKHEYQPCPCAHHFDQSEVYECGGCGREIVEAAHWPLDEDGDTRYTHIDGTGRALGEDCTERPVSRNVERPEPEPEPEPGACTCPDDDCRETCVPCLSLDDDAPCVRQAEEMDEYDALLAEFDDDDETYDARV